MSNPATPTCIGNSCLDYGHFEVLSIEALRLIRARKKQAKPRKGKKVKSQVVELKETTTAAVSTRLSTSQQ